MRRGTFSGCTTSKETIFGSYHIEKSELRQSRKFNMFVRINELFFLNNELPDWHADIHLMLYKLIFSIIFNKLFICFRVIIRFPSCLVIPLHSYTIISSKNQALRTCHVEFRRLARICVFDTRKSPAYARRNRTEMRNSISLSQKAGSAIEVITSLITT